MIDELIAVSGLPGLYKMVANRNNGLIVEDIETGKRRFCSIRKHQFTPLGSISIYTMTDTISLQNVLRKIDSQENEYPVPDTKADKSILVAYFANIVPDFDRDKVYPSDIKKLIKWYQFLQEHNLLADILVDKKSDEEE